MANSGLCECGCGETTNIARSTNARLGHVRGEPFRFIIGHHLRANTGERNNRWKGGRIVEPRGYVKLYLPDHPRANSVGYVYEHIVIAERALGHPLPDGAVVHHFDENKSNNGNGNLVICQDEAYHHLLHARQRAVRRSLQSSHEGS